MTTARVTEMVCDLCGESRVWDNVVEARANGWMRGALSDDLCPDCAKAVLRG